MDTASKPTSVTLARGKFLVTCGGCHDCHTPKLVTGKGPALDTKRLLAGFPSSEKVPTIPEGVIGPKSWGGLFTNDLTGKTPGGRPILPPMPWEEIQQANDKDLKAILVSDAGANTSWRSVMRRMAWMVVFLLVPALAFAEMPTEENINAVAGYRSHCQRSGSGAEAL